MRVMRPHILSALAFAIAFGLLATVGLAPARAQDAAARGPHPDLDPPAVVQAMLGALKKNTDQGIAELYRFSSPGNRQKTGPIENFRAMIREGFPDMLGHRDARVGPPLIDGDRAMLPVEVVGSDSQRHRYIFLLSRQTGGECKDCWMADAVINSDADGGEDERPEYGA
jgi:hypothetical protein